ncbi:MAG: DNA polymerase [Oscillospiraceae bacterium]
MTNNYKTVTTLAEINDYIGKNTVVAFALKTAANAPYSEPNKASLDPSESRILGCSLSVKEGTGIYVPVSHMDGENIDKNEFYDFLESFLTDKNITKVAHNMDLASTVVYALGIVIQAPVYDTICASQMIQTGAYSFHKLSECGLDTLSEEFFHETLPPSPAEADFTLRLYHLANNWFEKYYPKYRYIVEKVESPTAVYLGLMKYNGIPLDIPLMKKREAEADAELNRLKEAIQFIIGDIDIGANCSTKAFRDHIFEKLALPVFSRTETGSSSLNDEVLTQLKEYCDTIKPELSELFTLVQEYRKWGKIKSTYIDGYLKYLNPITGRIHPNILAMSTDTGRMSCNSPNAQNMPSKTNDPIGVRSFIKAPEGHVILSVDFSQIELRVGAFYCRDEVMLDTYRKNGDIHAATTSVIFGISYEQAKDKNAENYKERRTIAKNVNFGTFYGLFPKGLQKTLKFKAGIDRTIEECQEILSKLKSGYRRLVTWQEEAINNAKTNKYTETWLGRKRYLPDIDSSDRGKRFFAERCALNTPIQGTAADILKLSIGRILEGLPDRKWLKPILQIHDELTFIVPEDKLSEAVEFVRGCMEEKPFPEFDIPLIAEASAGKDFGTMKEMEDMVIMNAHETNIYTAKNASMTETKTDTANPVGMPVSNTADPAIKKHSSKFNLKDILGSMFKSEETVCIRIFSDKKDSTFPGKKLSCKLKDLSTILPELKEHNAHDRGIFYVVNYGGHTDKEITRINAQYVEMDNISIEEQKKKIKEFPLPPSLVIQTLRSLHVYFFVDETATVEDFRPIQKQLVKYFDGDPACVNESRVMRLPGFYHCKTSTPVKVNCLCFHPERVYTQQDIAKHLPPLEEKPADKKVSENKVFEKKENALGLTRVFKGCDFLQHCEKDAATLSEQDWYAMITNLAVFEGGTDLIHKLSASYPGYSKDKTQGKINHFLNSGTGPMTCAAICEKGFKCPKFESGECKAKSPAALCHIPMNTEQLIDELSACKITGNAMTDIQTAKQFIIDHLYNQDDLTAEACIKSSLLEHFKLGCTFSRQLMNVYNEICTKNKLAKNKKAKEDSPLRFYKEGKFGLSFMPGVMAEYIKDNYNIFYAASRYYLYKNGVYNAVPDADIQRIIQSNMLATEMTSNHISDTDKQLKLMVQKDTDELNQNPYIINLKNGLFNVLDNTLTEHTPDYYSTIRLNVSYKKGADCPLFKDFLLNAMNGNKEQVSLIQEILGYCMIPVNLAQKAFIFVGEGGSGKSVLLNSLSEILLGPQYVSNIPLQSIGDRFTAAMLYNMLVDIFSDLDKKAITETGFFKALTGGDYITAERKHKDPFSFKPFVKLLFSCNSIPKNHVDNSDGFYRRLLIIRFANSVPPEKRDPHLIDKFKEEADGIFMFALEGLQRLIKNDFKFSETEDNKMELEKYRIESDPVLSFMEDCCETDPSYCVGSTELYNKYKAYCSQNGLPSCSHKKFINQIKSANPGITRDTDSTGRIRVLKGIRLSDIHD